MLDGTTLTDRVLGCVIGGAVGDALGAPFEGLWAESIPAPAALLADYALFEGYPSGQYTDDTQLTLATLESIAAVGDIDPEDIAQRIMQLWRSQAVVGPGGACTAAADAMIAGGHWSTSGAPVGQAGNGAAMRTAALGLWFLHDPKSLIPAVGDISRITHRDPRSVAGGVAVAEAARWLACQKDLEAVPLCNAVAEAMRPIDTGFAEIVERLPDYLAKDRAGALEYVAWAGSAPDFPRVIITPYVVPTVLASLWAVTSFPASWPDAVAAVIGLGGDVDTLGAIVGGLMGARHGVSAVPAGLARGVLRTSHLRKVAARYAATIERQGRE